MTISIRNVSKTFNSAKGDVLAVADVSLHIAPGEFVSILGPSGCGKSTLLMMMAGLEPMSSGVIDVDDTPVLNPRRDFGLIFQDPTLLPWLTAEQNVLFPVKMMRLDVDAYRERARELLKRVGLGDAMDRRPVEMSGGMRQRVALCRSLIHDPAKIFMDEPFSALDALTRDEMAHVLLALWDRDAGNKTRIGIFVTHSIREAVLLSDRVVVMAKRPSRVCADVAIDFERPRPPGIQDSAQFNAMVAELRQYIEPSIH
jgi:NitT/TauT family transport system ATP-binding protein